MASVEPFNVYIGWDSREECASYVAAHSITRRTRSKTNIRYLKHRELRSMGIFRRPWMTLGERGENIDLLDGRTFSTEFSHTRFLVPALQGYEGWALFMDADMLFQCDIKELFAHCDDKYAIMCVKHSYPPAPESIKMDNRAQRVYHKKNHSSFVLWNCGHEANKQLTPDKVNFLPGADLHSFSWLREDQIGSLPFSYNFISGVSPPLEIGETPAVIHYSDGGPWFESHQDCVYAELWVEEFEDWNRNGNGNKYTHVPTTKYDTRI